MDPKRTSNLHHLIEQAREGQIDLRIAAIDELARHHPRQAMPMLADLAQDAEDAVRVAVVDALEVAGHTDPEAAGSALLGLIADASTLVRSEAAQALGALGNRQAVTRLGARLQADPEPLVRASAAEALGDLGDDRAVPILVAALADDDDAVRGYAANALGLIANEAVLPALSARLAVERALPVRAELHGARWRLGVGEDLELLIAIMESVEEQPAINLLNTLEDLSSRGRALPAEAAARLRTGLAKLARRLPWMEAHARKICDRLARE